MSPMREDLKQYIPQFEKLGLEAVRGMLNSHRYGYEQGLAAISWVAEKDEESRSHFAATRAEEVELNRSARDAAWEANRLAASANSLAEAANRNSADLADVQRRYNRIALAAVVISAIALIVSVVAIWKK